MSNNISFTCDSCGREVLGCNIVNGMKFCAKCYQETFGETDKDRKIAELQKQLKSQPAEIVEKIKEQLIKRLNTIAGYGRMTTDELSFLIETEFGSDLDTILKEYQING